MTDNRILLEDLRRIADGLTERERSALSGRNIFITGFAGSLGFMLVQFFAEYGQTLGVKHIYVLDNYIFGKPLWVHGIESHPLFTVREGDVTKEDFSFACDADLIFHMASLASPVYYRLHPIETMDADVVGLRRLLEFYNGKGIFNLLFYSTSEIYGDPDPRMVPTPESYWGNVNSSGPRSCYDESKRYAETLCYNFHDQKGFPVTVVRPFNSFGPGLRTNDKRAPADFAMNILRNEPIVLYSDGKATRTFCYASDTTLASLKCALYARYDIFNIGNEAEEMTIRELAEIYLSVGNFIFGYNGSIIFREHTDKHYNTDNPQRRRPDLTKIKKVLDYMPSVDTHTGVERYLRYLEMNGNHEK
ncbi:NAD-dependent epimerase/dehydratase family protein [Paenibacillus sp.]|jgi:UDP-glucuronate decarboxylase|uniref:NAD-dependent epimerase/dehydratase family protein n=1 Tax=Paenibacillus sp. TaxID=58172 RepID=UPI00282C41BE|nr:NAD-dependent epimerase/dehydratase family protein [Paenibacillus sp.]MDR0271561.1 NAD-dependent epimerase/dehydratase family protein [Paenibacillus sp.]